LDSYGSRVANIAQNVPLSNDTIQRRVSECATDIFDQLIADLKQSSWFSIALDECTDNSSQAQLCLFARFIRGSIVVEDLLSMLNLGLHTRVEDVYHAVHAVNNFFTEHGLTWNKVSEVNVDGAPAMIGGVTGFRGLLIRDHPDIRVNHCLIHRHALTSKDLSPAFDVVMKPRFLS